MRCFLFILLAGSVCFGQTAAHPDDSVSIDAVIQTLYHGVSGVAGAKRDWSRLGDLFLPQARLIATNPDKAGKPNIRIVTFPEYAQRVGVTVSHKGVFESEVKRQTRQFGNVAQVFSSYEIRDDPKGDVTLAGVNALQFYFDGKRWWITSLVWDTDRPGNRLPKELEK